MKIHTLILGDFQTNSYCLTATDTAKDCVIIDTGLASQPLIDFLNQNNLKPLALILTHGHADHIAGVNLLRETFPEIKIAIHKNDAEMLTKASKNLSMLTGAFFKTAPADIIIEEEGPIFFADIEFDVLHTPGHTPGGISLMCKQAQAVFVGDTLFAGSIGRTDFPGGDFNQLIDAIKQKLLTLPDKTQVYPGHGQATTIATEKQQNQYVGG
jgi:glyoxylase-like metal-dependent hydrolase (beta-lactamase superfamily II)